MSKTKKESNSADLEKIKTAKLTLEAMGVKPEDLVTIKPVSLEIKIRLDYDPQAENPVKVDLVNVESVTDKSLTIDTIREFIKKDTHLYLSEVCTERYFGYREIGNLRRYVLLIEERADDKICISLSKTIINELDLDLFRLAEEKYTNTDEYEYNTYILKEYYIYIYPFPEDDAIFLNILPKYNLSKIFERQNQQNEIVNKCRKLVFSPYTEELSENFEKIIIDKIPEGLLEELTQSESLSISIESSRFSYMYSWIMPIKYGEKFIEDFIYSYLWKKYPPF